LIAWAIVGVTRRGGEPFTLATATALYARVLLIGGILMSLTGVGIILKAGFGFINAAYSYYPTYSGYAPLPTAPGAPPAGFDLQQRSQDLVLGITLLVIGALVAGGHLYLGRAVAHMPGGSPGWIVRGTLLGLTVTTAVVGIPSAAVGLYQVLSYFIVGTSSQSPQPWGETLGLAIAFVPAWIYLMTRLVRALRRPHVGVSTA
jgi:hypothetical protein